MTAQDRSARISQLQEYVQDYCRKVAKGKITTLKGRPLTAQQLLFMRNAANGHIAKEKGCITLATLLMVFPAESWREFAEDDDPWCEGADYEAAYEAVLFRAKRDVLSGRLVVRNVLTLFPVNEADEVRAWAANPEADAWSELTCRLVVTDEDVKTWLARHGMPTPDWLDPDVPLSRSAGWAALDVFKSYRRRKQVEIIELLVQELGFEPRCIPDKGVSQMRTICIERHKEYFTDNSFDNCWSELSKAHLVRVENYDIYYQKSVNP